LRYQSAENIPRGSIERGIGLVFYVPDHRLEFSDIDRIDRPLFIRQHDILRLGDDQIKIVIKINSGIDCQTDGRQKNQHQGVFDYFFGA
jgi:hypothetical protein